MTATTLFVDKTPSWNKLQMHFLSLCSYIYECPYWQLKATKQQCVSLCLLLTQTALCSRVLMSLSWESIFSYQNKGYSSKVCLLAATSKQHISDNKKQKIMLLPTIQKAFWLLCIKPVISSHFVFQNLLINKRYIVIIPSTSPSVHSTANKRVLEWLFPLQPLERESVFKSLYLLLGTYLIKAANMSLKAMPSYDL